MIFWCNFEQDFLVMEEKKISVLGCGWLGFSLAKQLINNGFIVKGSTTTKEKLDKLKAVGITPFLVDLDRFNEELIGDFLHDSNFVIINVPPRRKIKEVVSYSRVLANLLPFIKADQKVIFVSSTSVYQNTNDWVGENLELFPETESGKAVLEAEKCLRANLGSQLTIVRFAGLIGENRHPGKFLAGKTNLPNAKAPVNIIHQEDCIGLILGIIENDFFGEVVNGVAMKHPSRKDFYTQAAQSLDLIAPSFAEESVSSYKLISNAKSIKELGYCYLYDNPMSMI